MAMKKQLIAVLVVGAMQLAQGSAWASTGHEGSSNYHSAAATTRSTVGGRAPRLRRVVLRGQRGAYAIAPHEGTTGGLHVVQADAALGDLAPVLRGVVGTRDGHDRVTQHAAGGLEASRVFVNSTAYTIAVAHNSPINAHHAAFEHAAGMTDEMGRVASALAGHAAAGDKSPAQREHLTQAAIAAGQAQQIYATMKGLHGSMRDAHVFARDHASQGNHQAAVGATNKAIGMLGTAEGAIGKANDIIKNLHIHVTEAAIAL